MEKLKIINSDWIESLNQLGIKEQKNKYSDK